MVKNKIIKTKKNVATSNWNEDDVSNATNEVDKKKVKPKPNSKDAAVIAGKMKKTKKEKKKNMSKGSKKGSDDENFGASLDKLKEIDPAFYKVII